MAEIVFVASHTNAIRHFEEFQVALRNRGIESELVTVEKMTEVERVCDSARIVFVGIGNEFCLGVIRKFHDKVIVYYDNPTRDVPGKYGEVAREAICEGTPVMYANKHLATEGGDIGLGYARLKTKEILYLGSAVDNAAGFQPFCDVIRATEFERPTTLSYRPHPRGDQSEVEKLKGLQKKNLRVTEDSSSDALASIRYVDQVCFFQTSLEVDAKLMRRECMAITEAEQASEFAAWISDRTILDKIGYDSNWAERLYQEVVSVKA